MSDKRVDANDGRMAQADSRDRLEADIAEWCDNDSGEISMLKKWLDRQAAITERERNEYWQHIAAGNELLETDKYALQDHVDSLTAERDKLRIERDELKNELNEYKESLAGCNAYCRYLQNQLIEYEKGKTDER